MTLHMYRPGHFQAALRSLATAGGKSALVVQRVETILEALSREGAIPGRVHALSRHGEARIPNCLKYDLGSGYRLVIVKDGKDVITLFVGTHDDCDRWIENHKGLQPALEGECRPYRSPGCLGLPPEGPPLEPLEPVDEDRFSPSPIEDHILRRVFAGLCRE